MEGAQNMTAAGILSDLGKRAVITLGLISVYKALTLIPLPFIDVGVYLQHFRPDFFSTSSRLSIAPFGLTPFVSAFLITELLTFVIPHLKRLREGGVVGRKRINQIAVAAAVIFAVVQANGVYTYLVSVNEDMHLIANPGLAFRIASIFAMVAGTLLVFAIAVWISRFGIGNGFCILFLLGDVLVLLESFIPLATRNNLEQSARINPLGFAIIALLVVSVLVVFRRTPKVNVSSSGQDLSFSLPAFPQGIFALTLSSTVLAFPLFSKELNIGPMTWEYVAAYGVLVLLLSCLGFYLFSSPARIKKHLFDRVQFSDDLVPTLKRHWILTTAVLVVAGSLILLPVGLFFSGGPLIGLAQIALIIAIVLDVRDEWDFRKSFAESEYIISLDNAHLAAHFKGLLDSHEIAHFIQAYRYRRLFFFLKPLVKMDLYVAASTANKTRELLKIPEIKIV